MYDHLVYYTLYILGILIGLDLLVSTIYYFVLRWYYKNRSIKYIEDKRSRKWNKIHTFGLLICTLIILFGVVSGFIIATFILSLFIN